MEMRQMDSDGMWQRRNDGTRCEMGADSSGHPVQQVEDLTHNEAHEAADEDMDTAIQKTREEREKGEEDAGDGATWRAGFQSHEDLR